MMLEPIVETLETRHHTEVAILGSFGLELTTSRRRVVVVYAFESFSSWYGYNMLQDWEREAAQWSAMAEFDLWMEGLENEGLEEEAQQAFVALFDVCEEAIAETSESPRIACSEPELWRRGLELLGYEGCGVDRVGIASVELEVTTAGVMIRSPSSVFEAFRDRRCRCDVATLVPVDSDDDEDLELVVELEWRSDASRQGSVLEHVELRILGAELQDQLRREILSRERPRDGGQPAPGAETSLSEARYWFSGRRVGGDIDLVIERFELPPRCSPRACSRMSDDAISTPCFPLGALESTNGCAPLGVERTVLSYDAENEVWL